jgi:hypothetical protein
MSKDFLAQHYGDCFTHARKTLSVFIKTKKLDIPFEDETLRKLMHFHPGKKYKNFLYFSIKKVSPYFRPCLTLTLPCKTVVVVSWIKCLRKIYDLNDPVKNRRLRVLSAFRSAILTSPKMLIARECLNKCEECKCKSNLHVDHDVKPFAQILDEFLDLKKLKLNKINLNYQSRPYTLMSAKLTKEWIEYHDENATLIGLCATCNSSKGSGGYRYKN